MVVVSYVVGDYVAYVLDGELEGCLEEVRDMVAELYDGVVIVIEV